MNDFEHSVREEGEVGADVTGHVGLGEGVTLDESVSVCVCVCVCACVWVVVMCV